MIMSATMLVRSAIAASLLLLTALPTVAGEPPAALRAVREGTAVAADPMAAAGVARGDRDASRRGLRARGGPRVDRDAGPVPDVDRGADAGGDRRVGRRLAETRLVTKWVRSKHAYLIARVPEPTTPAPGAPPTDAPTSAPTSGPTAKPTQSPTYSPTAEPTQAPTSGPTAAPTPAPTAPLAASADAKYHVVCGKGTGCKEGNEREATADEQHEVRCCADATRDGWTKRAGCAAWTASLSCHTASFAGAAELCANAEARLCTKAELAAKCTKGSGCGFDGQLIWSSSPGGSGPN